MPRKALLALSWQWVLCQERQVGVWPGSLRLDCLKWTRYPVRQLPLIESLTLHLESKMTPRQNHMSPGRCGVVFDFVGHCRQGEKEMGRVVLGAVPPQGQGSQHHRPVMIFLWLWHPSILMFSFSFVVSLVSHVRESECLPIFEASPSCSNVSFLPGVELGKQQWCDNSPALDYGQPNGGGTSSLISHF